MRVTWDRSGPAPTPEEAAAIVAALQLATEAGPAPAPLQAPPRWALGDRAPVLLDPWLDRTAPGTAWRLSGR